MKKFESILVANRGEIACRVLRSARDLGYRSIAVYSEADIDAPHVALADEATLIGPAPVGKSYLDIERILGAAARTGAQAIHPGYGLLSENANFARACEGAGLVFVGPTASAIELMGNKAEARRRMIDAGVPCVPGFEGRAQDDETLARAAEEIGFPVMVKAAMGGGGRGMRLVTEPAGLPDALRQARSEAESAFGSGELILEKAIVRPRHVEIQVFADEHGQVIHLGERDCSIQRRHQKVVEESPCPVMTDGLRARMGAAAVEAARSIGYVGAGTVEFLLDENGEFYFLEMNTRLQVEHPVTEAVTGLDLVALQISVAQSERLPLGQEDLVLDGHAIEVRLYAEDPEKDFMPGTGRIALWHPPHGEGIRVDDGIATGLEISPYYDAMVAKIIAWGASRESARLRLLRALNETAVFGISTNRDFLIRVLRNETFVEGAATTAFIEENSVDLAVRSSLTPFHRQAIAAIVDYRAGAKRSMEASVQVSPVLLDWSSAGSLFSHCLLSSGDSRHKLTVASGRSGYTVSDTGSRCVIEVHNDDGITAEISIDGASHRVIYCTPARGVTWIALEGLSERHVNQAMFTEHRDEAAGGARITAPMHGQLLEVNVTVGDRVQKGQRVLVMEAMKMQHEILAGINGMVLAVNAGAGDQLGADELIIELKPDED